MCGGCSYNCQLCEIPCLRELDVFQLVLKSWYLLLHVVRFWLRCKPFALHIHMHCVLHKIEAAQKKYKRGKTCGMLTNVPTYMCLYFLPHIYTWCSLFCCCCCFLFHKRLGTIFYFTALIRLFCCVLYIFVSVFMCVSILSFQIVSICNSYFRILYASELTYSERDRNRKSREKNRFDSGPISSTSAYLTPLAWCVFVWIFFCMLSKAIDSCFKWNLWTNLSSYLVESAGEEEGKMECFCKIRMIRLFNNNNNIIETSNIFFASWTEFR